MKSWLKWLACRLGLVAWARQRNRREVAVLMYHGVVADDEALAEGDWLQVRASEFRRQMAYLARHYRVVDFAEALADGADSDQPRAIVTFDDGYANNYTVALPILAALNLKATVFVATGQVGTARLFWWDRLRLAAAGQSVPAAQIARFKALPAARLEAEVDAYIADRGWTLPNAAPEAYRSLSRDELLALSRSGRVEIGSHTHGHEILEHLSDAEVTATVDASCAFLRAQGLAPRYFAAPNGDYHDRQIPLLARAGLQACVATREGLWLSAAGAYRIPRLGIGRGCALADFALALSGLPARWREWRQGGR